VTFRETFRFDVIVEANSRKEAITESKRRVKMFDNLWDNTYRYLKTKLQREPSTREIQIEMLDKMFNSHKLKERSKK